MTHLFCTLKKIAFLLCMTTITFMHSQVLSTNKEFEAQVIGGNEQIEQVLQTQLTLPKTVLTSNFETEITLFFDIDPLGKATNIKCEGVTNNSLRNELKRLLHFFTFEKTAHISAEVHPYFLTFNLSTKKYSRYFKQKNKLNFKNSVSADSSFTIYTKADKAPEYYKNGDDGLTEFILASIEYPKVAIEKSIQGTVILEFIVETNGYVTNIVPKQTVNGGCTEEAIRLIKQTKWQPALLNNKLVRYKINYPIAFTLMSNMKDNNNTNQHGQ